LLVPEGLAIMQFKALLAQLKGRKRSSAWGAESGMGVVGRLSLDSDEMDSDESGGVDVG